MVFFIFLEFCEFENHLILVERLRNLKHLRVGVDSLFAFPVCQIAGPQSLVDQSEQSGRVSRLANEMLICVDGPGVVVLFG